MSDTPTFLETTDAAAGLSIPGQGVGSSESCISSVLSLCAYAYSFFLLYSHGISSQLAPL